MGLDGIDVNRPERGRQTKPGQSRRNELRSKPKPEAAPTVDEATQKANEQAQAGGATPPGTTGGKRRRRRSNVLDKVVGKQQELIAGWVLDLGEGIDEIKGAMESEGLKAREVIEGYRAIGELAITATNLLRMVHDKPGSLSDSDDVERRVGQLIQLNQRRGGAPLPLTGTLPD